MNPLIALVIGTILGLKRGYPKGKRVQDGEEILASGRKVLEAAGLKGPFADKLLVGDPSRIIAEEAAEGHYTLILIGARGLSSLKQLLLGSVSGDVLHRVSRATIGIVYL